MKKRLTDLSLKIKTTIQPVFISRKLNEDLKFREVKPAIVNQQCLVYQFQCNLCDAGYVGYTTGGPDVVCVTECFFSRLRRSFLRPSAEDMSACGRHDTRQKLLVAREKKPLVPRVVFT